MFLNTTKLAEQYLLQAHSDIVKGDFVGAKAKAKTAIKLNPRYFEAHNTLGACLSMDKDLVGALACFDTSLKIQPNQIEAKLNRVTALEMLGERLNLKPLDLKSMAAFGNETMGCAIFVREDSNDV